MPLLSDLATIYTEDYYKNHLFYKNTYIKLAKMFYEKLRPFSVLDFGCGSGFMLEYFIHFVPSQGLDGSVAVKKLSRVTNLQDFIEIVDFRKPFCLNKIFDLVLCIEVAEHIEPEFTDVFIDNLCKHGNMILMTTAKVGQGGTNHVNCQPKKFWIDKITQKGFEFDEDFTNKIENEACEIIDETKCPISYLKGNFSFYKRLGYLKSLI